MVVFFSFDAFAIEVGSIADSRFDGIGWTLDGEYMGATRDKLLATSNFGSGGTVPEAVNITDVAGTIDYTVLSQFDVFFIGYLSDDSGAAFSNAELVAFQDWVSAGGTMVITCDDADFDAVCEAFGLVPSASDATPPVTPTVAGSSHAVFDGPFGMPASLEMSGTQTYFDDIGGFTILARDQDLNPIVLEDQIGSGRVIAFTDVDMISSYTLSEGTGIDNDNDKFLGNLFAYLAGEAGETFFINAGLNGHWYYGPARSGEGVQLEVKDLGGDAYFVATVYSYDDAGNQIFLIALGVVKNDGTVDVDVYITEGGLWGDDFDPLDVKETQWGTGTFSADHCGKMRMSLTPNSAYQNAGYTNLAYDLERLPAGEPIVPCPLVNP
jgi:hypothetical protein